MFLSALSSTLVGLVLVVFPWTEAWDANYLLQSHPLVREVVLSTVTRGVVSGIGLVNFVLAFYEARRFLLGHDRAGR